MEAGKETFLALVKSCDAAVEVVIPTAPSRSVFLISLTKGSNRKFLTLHEDDLLDLPTEPSVQQKTTALLQETIRAL
ncbi:MAG TPA: hypothetical protein PKZ24_07780 [Nitrospirales bacterium]|nr:hypothetical protein [Nitrospirales bacterium]